MNTRALRRGCATLLLALWTVVAYAQLPEIEIDLDGHKLIAEVASTQEQQTQGLMFRRMLPENRGMLFVFDAPQALHFWMKNTYLPLSIAFIDADGVIINITDMQPQTTNIHSSARPAKFALEVNQGWFRQHGIASGMRIAKFAHFPPVQ